MGVTTPLVRKLLISSLTESESWLITVPVFKVSLSSIPPVVDVDLDLVLFFLRDFPLTMVGSPSFPSLSPLLLKSLLPSSSHTTTCFLPMPFLSTLTVLSVWITKPFTMYAEDLLILRDQLTPISTDSLVKLFLLLLPPFVSMVLLTSMLLNSRPILSHTQEFTSCLPRMLLSSLPRRRTTSNFPSPRSPTLCSSHPTCLPSVTHVMVSSWLAA